MIGVARAPGLLRRLVTARRAGVLLLLLALGLVAPQLRSGTELVRIRHALTLGPELVPGQDWLPPAIPKEFKVETLSPDPYFVAIAEDLGLAAMADDWQRALAISGHLLGSSRKRSGGAIQSDLKTTHAQITTAGRGYCGDFVRVFTAIANAAGMTVRPWAFSFDGFGGHGHIWVEVWNRQSRIWQLVDVFQNYQYVLGNSDPLSAAQLRTALAADDPTLRILPLRASSAPGWAVEAKARDYLRRGLSEWYVPWGNNVMTLDGSRAVRWAGTVSRAFEGLAAIASGVQPQVRILATPDNAPQRAALQALRQRLAWAVAAAMTGLVVLGWSLRKSPRPIVAPVRATSEWPSVCVVGPLPPPSGGMANQCEQLLRLLRNEGVSVDLVRTNAPYWPPVLGRVPGLRALARLLPYVVDLWRSAGRCDVMHVLANSGWAWHLFAAPAIWVGALRGTPVVVNYRGGQADEFLSHAPSHVHRSLRRAALRVTPSAFLRRVFARHGLDAEVIPNIIDLERFPARASRDFGDSPSVIVARNLEPIYGLDTAIRALALLRHAYPKATLTVAGSGAQLDELLELAARLGLADAVHFPGRIEHANMPALYACADVALNPSTIDNMPNSVLEAFASAVPLVSTDAGGVPDIVDDGVSGLLVPVGDAAAMAAALGRVLGDPALARRMVQAGSAAVAAYAWPQVRQQWRNAYGRVCVTARAAA